MTLGPEERRGLVLLLDQSSIESDGIFPLTNNILPLQISNWSKIYWVNSKKLVEQFNSVITSSAYGFPYIILLYINNAFSRIQRRFSFPFLCYMFYYIHQKLLFVDINITFYFMRLKNRNILKTVRNTLIHPN